MTASEALKQTWAAVALDAPPTEGYYRRRIPLASAWPAHAGIHRPTDARILLLETDARDVRGLRLKDETRGYSITVGPDDAGRAGRSTIRIHEATTGFREIFSIFCSDILEHWLPHTAAPDALKVLAARLARWRKFFQAGDHLSGHYLAAMPTQNSCHCFYNALRATPSQRPPYCMGCHSQH